MAVIKNTSAIKIPPKHLLGIQNLSIQEAKQILKEAKVICTTCNTSYDKRLYSFKFKHVLIDEAT